MFADAVSGQILCLCVSAGKEADLKLVAKSRVGLSPRIRCVADLAYMGLGKRFAQVNVPHRKPPNRNGVVRQLTEAQRQANKVQRRERVGIEHLIRRLKVFALLAQRYRNRRKRFGLRVNLIAALVNRDRNYTNLNAQKHL